jgi:outer membrane translocation and assembly module TamA
MRVAGHACERGEMFVAQCVRPRGEDFADFEIVEVTLRHRVPFPLPIAREEDVYSITLSARSSSEFGTSPAIFNVDAQAGLSYSFSPNMKITVDYRFDDFFKALKTVTVVSPTTPTVAVTSIDRAYSGPMARLTFKY